MEYHYSEVAEIIDDEANKTTWRYFNRQLLVASCTWVVYFLCGLSFGLPTVMIPQLRKAANSTEAVGEEMASWLSSIFGYSAIPWVVILCVLTRKFGRKLPFIFVCINTLTYNLLQYFSVNTTQILISEIMQGINHASNVTLSIIIVSEYTAPKYRGAFLAIKSASIYWGIWAANAIGSFCHWRYIPLLGIILSFYTIGLVFWPESPQWLASQGRFEECKTSHRWLRGLSTEAEKELQKLIESQKNLKKTTTKFLKNAFETVTCKAFYKPILLSAVMMMQCQFSGKIVCMVYAIDIIKKITGDESTAYSGMLILDGVTVSGMYLGCFLARILKRRTLLFVSSAIGITFLFILSVYLFLIDKKVITENNILTIVFLVVFSVTISAGPLILTTSIYAELIPLRYKSICTMTSAFTFVALNSTLLKLFPFLSKVFNMSGVFFFYAVTSTACAVVSFIYLPETKDKTLQEIEDIFNEKSNSNNKELIALKK